MQAHMATVKIDAMTLAGQTTNATRIMINGCTVSYAAVSDPAAPAIAPVTSNAFIVLNVGSSITQSLELFTEAQQDWFAATGNTTYPFYDVTYSADRMNTAGTSIPAARRKSS